MITVRNNNNVVIKYYRCDDGYYFIKSKSESENTWWAEKYASKALVSLGWSVKSYKIVIKKWLTTCDCYFFLSFVL